MRLTRRQLLAGGAAGALGAAGVYELVDRLAGDAPERRAVEGLPAEQHVLDGVEVVFDDLVEVLVPPLHHQIVTAKVKAGDSRKELRAAQDALEDALRTLEERYEPSPRGLGITVAWGLPYFRRYVPNLADEHIPVDRRASTSRNKPVKVLIDAIRFPSDPEDTVLEGNDVAVLLRSDSLDHIADASKLLFDELDVFRPTSIRKGFVGGGFDGKRSLPKQMAVAAGVPGADLIPETSELFLGFTSSQKAGLGPRRIANVETLGYAEGGYFRQGTHMHLSHLFEDIEAWFVNFDHAERVATAFRPGLDVAFDAQTVAQPPEESASPEDVRRDFAQAKLIGHSGAIQTTSRLDRDIFGADGVLYPKGTAVPQRADFNTLDNPFFWTASPDRDRAADGPAAGLHFVVFNPTSDDFHRNRLAMDGILPDGTRLPFQPRDRGQGFNSVLQTTHRQNFLVPPRRHRSFPLVELLA